MELKIQKPKCLTMTVYAHTHAHMHAHMHTNDNLTQALSTRMGERERKKGKKNRHTAVLYLISGPNISKSQKHGCECFHFVPSSLCQ